MDDDAVERRLPRALREDQLGRIADRSRYVPQDRSPSDAMPSLHGSCGKHRRGDRLFLRPGRADDARRRQDGSRRASAVVEARFHVVLREPASRTRRASTSPWCGRSNGSRSCSFIPSWAVRRAERNGRCRTSADLGGQRPAKPNRRPPRSGNGPKAAQNGAVAARRTLGPVAADELVTKDVERVVGVHRRRRAGRRADRDGVRARRPTPSSRPPSRRVFAVKGRPATHPLIVHIGAVDDLDRWVDRRSGRTPPCSPRRAGRDR